MDPPRLASAQFAGPRGVQSPACSIEEGGAASLEFQEDRGGVEAQGPQGERASLRASSLAPAALETICSLILEQQFCSFFRGTWLKFGIMSLAALGNTFNYFSQGINKKTIFTNQQL